jgi:membrane peptidoglycan carboxypeptidase
MPENTTRRTSAVSSFLGLLGMATLSGVIVTAMVAPAIAVTGVATNSAIGVFDSLPEFIDIGEQAQKNTLWAMRTNDPEDGYIPIAELYWQDREEITLDEMSPHLISAAIAGEDRRFFEHAGVDAPSVVRAALGNFLSGDIQSGASTLTMQLVKNIYVQRSLYLPTEEERREAYQQAIATNFERKLNEMKLAIGLEKRSTKEDILQSYLNITGFGGNTYGVQSASERYFGKSASDLTPAEAASLIAIVQYPSTRNLANPENFAANQARRDVILRAMYAEDFITEAQLNQALATPVNQNFINLSRPSNGCLVANEYARFFCDYVVKNVRNFESLGATPEERENRWRLGGLNVYTSLNMQLQEISQDRVWEIAPNDVERFELGGAAISVETSTGRIVTMAQNKVFNDTEEGGGLTATAVNFNTDRPFGGSSGFQVGSTYKIYALLAWLQRGYGLSEIVDASTMEMDQAEFIDTCLDGGGPWGGEWVFRNSANAQFTSVSVSQAVSSSINSAFASMARALDQCEIRRAAEALNVGRGDGQPLQTNPAAVLGTNEISPLTMASSFAGIANGGVVCKPIVVDRFIDANGETIPGQQPDCRQGITPDVAAAAAAPMRSVLTSGTGTASNPGGPVPIIGKTGTTDSQNHTWMVGSSTEISTAVWVGNVKGEFSLARYTNGRNLRHQIFRTIMAEANEMYGGEAFPSPPERLLVGSGIPLPELTGFSVGEAQTVLAGLGLRLGVRGVPDEEIPFTAFVAGMETPAGSRIARGQAIYVVLTMDGGGSFVPQLVMPDLISPPAKTLAQAQQILAERGFTGPIRAGCEASRSQGNDLGTGYAIGQSPEPGQAVSGDVGISLAFACGVGPAPGSSVGDLD